MSTPHDSSNPPPPPPPSSNPRRLPPPCWSPDETVALIDAYRHKWYSLRRGNLKANHWQDVADSVSLRCPSASPPKTAVQCRHKMEKLRKRYRTEIQRSRSVPLSSKFSSSWVHFKLMDAMEKGPLPKPHPSSDTEGDDDYDDDNDSHPNNSNNNNNNNHHHQAFYPNGISNTVSQWKTPNKLYHNGISNTNSSVRIRIPTGVSIAQPGPRFYAKIDNQEYGGMGSNSSAKVNYGGGSGVGSSRVIRGTEEMARRKREREPMEEMVAAIKGLGDGFVRVEQMKMEMGREIESMRMEMEMKRTQMILESQHRIVEAFAKALAEKK